jgi:hypothetical protein
MRVLRAWLIRLGGLFGKERREREFAEEMEDHLRRHIEDNLRSGMTLEQARRNALMKLGGLEPIKEMYRERRGLPILETLLQDVRYSFRALRKNLSFTTLAVITLTLGMGANIAIFSMVNALLLHPYQFRDLDRLVRIWEDRGIDQGVDGRSIAAADGDDLRAGTQAFEALTTYRCQDFNLWADGSARPRFCQFLPCARREPGRRPNVYERRGAARGRSSRHRELWLLAALVWGRPGIPWKSAADEWAQLHDRRDHARWV